MTPSERASVLHRGVAVLRDIEAARRAALPPPERDTFGQLSAVRDVMSLADRIEIHLEPDSTDPDAVYARDAGLSTVYDPGDEAMLHLLEPEVRGDDARRAFQEFRALLTRYAALEFWPPDTWFGIVPPEP